MSFQSAIESRFGLKIVTDINLVDMHSKQVRFPRSKKKRIRKKWSKQGKNFKVWSTPKEVVYKIMPDTLLMHPAILERLKLQIAQQKMEKVADAAGFRIGGLY